MGYNKDVFENYKATKKDLEAIEDGIGAVWRKELDFIFKKKEVFDRTSIISFDSQFIYLWSKHKFSGLKREPTHSVAFGVHGAEVGVGVEVGASVEVGAGVEVGAVQTHPDDT